jgi:putative addiction module component (TIGR02574 family)
VFLARPLQVEHNSVMAGLSLEDIQRLSVSERVQLAEQIWDTIVATPEALPIPEAQIRELDRRLKLYNESPEAAESWSTIRSRLTEFE